LFIYVCDMLCWLQQQWRSHSSVNCCVVRTLWISSAAAWGWWWRQSGWWWGQWCFDVCAAVRLSSVL